MQLFIGALFWIRLLSIFCFFTFECGGKHFMIPFILYVLLWPFAVVQSGVLLFTDVHNPDFRPLVLLVGTGGIFLILYVFIRPIGNEFFRTDWRSQLGPLAVLLMYGSYLASFVVRGCWSDEYLPYAATPVLLFLVAQLGVFLANLRNPSPPDS